MRNDYGNYPYFSGQVILAAYKENTSLLERQALDRKVKELQREYSYTSVVSKVIPRNETAALLRYIQSQDTNINSYADYINACEYLGLDMTLPKHRYPHNFKRWHDMRIDQYRTAKALKDEEERKELYAKFGAIAEKYLSLQRSGKDAFVVIIARSPQDLIREGEALDHCVGRMNYDQRFVREESLIFFVCNVAAPDVPFVTVEYSLKNKKVLQCYGAHDYRPDDTVLDFVHKKWLPYANRQLKKIQAA